MANHELVEKSGGVFPNGREEGVDVQSNDSTMVEGKGRKSSKMSFESDVPTER